jgi:hypothetical protein
LLLLAVFEGALIGAYAVGLRLKVGSWTHPACLFAVFWAFMTCAPLLLVREIHTTPWSTGYLLLAAVAFGMPAFFHDWSKDLAIAHQRRNQPWRYSGGLLVASFAVCQISVLAMIAANLDAQGFPILTVLTDPIGTGCKYLALRYSGVFKPNIFSHAATILNYVGVIIAGLILAPRKSLIAQFGIIVLAILPSILDMILHADKGTFFLALAYMLGAVLVSRIASGDTALITWRTVAAGVVVLALLVPSSAIALLNRSTAGACTDEGRSATVVHGLSPSMSRNHTTSEHDKLTAGSSGFGRYARSYAFGHFFAFSDWFNSYISDGDGYTNPSRLTWGFWTFMAVGKHINPDYQLPDGYFDEYYNVDGVLTSNIYTIYRGMIYDIGIAGSLIFMILFGWLSSLAYRQMLSHENAPASQAYFIFLGGFVYTSYIISLLVWNSSWIVPLIIWSILWIRGRFLFQWQLK